MMGWKSQFARVGLGATMVASALGVAAAPSSADAVKRPMAVVARDFQFLGAPPILPAGQYDLRFFNISREEEHEFVALNVESCKSKVTTIVAAKALLDAIGSKAVRDAAPGMEPDFDAATQALCRGASFEGAAFAPPGQRDRQDFTLTPGRTLYFCAIPDEDGTPHFELGMIGFINVFSLPTGR